jgi:hypothetical protein
MKKSMSIVIIIIFFFLQNFEQESEKLKNNPSLDNALLSYNSCNWRSKIDDLYNAYKTFVYTLSDGMRNLTALFFFRLFPRDC